MATEDKNKRVVQIEIDDEVKKLTIEGVDKDAQVVMREELSDEELDGVAGGGLLHFGQNGMVATGPDFRNCPPISIGNTDCPNNLPNAWATFKL